jgi:hypothetical protein
MSELEWWGYVHTSGTVHAKRWFGDQRDLDEARESDFVGNVYGPFKATCRDDALARVNELHLLA